MQYSFDIDQVGLFMLRICLHLNVDSLGIRSNSSPRPPRCDRCAVVSSRLVSHVDIDALTGDRADVAAQHSAGHRVAWRRIVSPVDDGGGSNFLLP